MIKVKDTYIQAETEDVLKVLKYELAERGIERFAMFRHNGENIQTNCPFHNGGQEKKPSFGVNGDLNKCHCFACGWSGGLDDMISELFGFVDSSDSVRWLQKRFNSIEVENRPDIFGNYKREIVKAKKNIILEEELDSYRYIHPYHYKRGLTNDILEEFDVGYDKERQCVTFPILDLDGDCVFVATRSVNTKFFGLPKGLEKPVYQAYRFKNGQYKEAYIVESFFNCLTLWKLGLPSMALIGTGNEKQYNILKNLPVREYILCLDPDDAGRKATQRFKKYVNNKLLKQVVYEEDGKDINDLQEDFLKLKTVWV